MIALAATLTLGAGLALGQEGWGEEAWRAVGYGIGNVFQSLAPAKPAPRPRATLRSKQPASPASDVRAPATSPGTGTPVNAPPAPSSTAAPASPVTTPSPATTTPVLQPLPSEAAPGGQRPHAAAAGEPPAERAALLFEQANSARRKGHALEAGAFYRDLQARFPRSAEAQLSLALVARMQLDRGEYAAALAGFEDYLASSDRALREEAMAGRALALGHLGRARASEQAFAELLRAYPDSSYAALARRRLGAQERP